MLISVYIRALVKSFGKIVAIPITILFGIIVIVSVMVSAYYVWWLLFPGIYRLGGYVGNDLLGLDISDADKSPYRWMFGVLVIGFLPFSYYVGQNICKKLFAQGV